MKQLLLFALLSAGCAVEVDTTNLPSIDNYQSWESQVVIGPAPGHGDTYREIYINEVGRNYSHAGPYNEGTVFVKEIYSIRESDQPGDLLYVATMRKLSPDTDVGDASVHQGWLFTQFDAPGDPEVSAKFCFDSCHAQGPFDYAFFDYGR